LVHLTIVIIVVGCGTRDDEGQGKGQPDASLTISPSVVPPVADTNIDATVVDAEGDAVIDRT